MGKHAQLTTSPFFRLPRDCWEIIVQHLSFEELLFTSTTCRSLRASTERFIYRDIGWNWTTTIPLRRVLQLLRSILERPDLASTVENVSLFCSAAPWTRLEVCDMEGDQELSLRSFAPVVAKAAGIVQKVQLSPIEEWIEALRVGNFYAFVAVLSSQIPNITSFCLDYSFLWMGGCPGRMMEHAILLPNRAAVRELPTFDQLEKVDYGGNVPMYEEHVPEWNDPIPDYPPVSFNHDQFAGWLHLPALKRLEIWLRDTNFHLGLAYSYYDGYVFEKSDCIVHALESVRNSVERLSVGLDRYPVVFNERDFNGTEAARYEHVQGTLKQSTRLKTVELPICLLVSYDVYPDNNGINLSMIWPDKLCEVGLRIDMKASHENELDELKMVDWVYDVLLKQRHAVPHLQRVIIRFWKPFYDDLWQEVERRLKIKCEEMGILLECVNDDLSRGLWTRTIS